MGPVGITGHLGEALMNESSALEPAEKRTEGHTGHENLAAYISEVGPHLNMIIGLPAQRGIHSVGYKSLCLQDFVTVSQRENHRHVRLLSLSTRVMRLVYTVFICIGSLSC